MVLKCAVDMLHVQMMNAFSLLWRRVSVLKPRGVAHIHNDRKGQDAEADRVNVDIEEKAEEVLALLVW